MGTIPPRETFRKSKIFAKMTKNIFVPAIGDCIEDPDDIVVLQEVTDNPEYNRDSRDEFGELCESSDPDYLPDRHFGGRTSRKSPHKRPGRQPKVPDHLLNPDELYRVNRRRERNRQAAARCREKRLTKVEALEKEVEELKAGNKAKGEENEILRQERNALKAQLNPLKLENVPIGTTYQVTALTPLVMDQNFNFPVKVEANILH